jgi:hypothetical protein
LAACCALPAGIALGGYMAWLGTTYGDPLAFVHARKAWGYTQSAWFHASDYVRRVVSWELNTEGVLDLLAAGWLAAVAGLSWKKLGPAYALYAAATLLTPLASGQLWALARISLCVVPGFLLLAAWAERPLLRRVLLAAGLAAVAKSGVRFVNGWFTGS